MNNLMKLALIGSNKVPVALNLVIEGHSFVPTTCPFGDILTERVRCKYYYNSAVAGSVIIGGSNNITDRASTVDSKIVHESGVKNALVLWIGVNEITNVLGTGQAAYNNLKTYVQNRTDAGWTVFAYTCTPATINGLDARFEVERNVYNDAIRNDLSTLSRVYVINTDLVTELANSASTKYYIDLIHPTDIGEYLACMPLITKIKTLYSKIQIPATSEPISFNLASTGTGAGVSTLSLKSSKTVYITSTGNVKFYTDAAGTQNESTHVLLVVNQQASFYLKCASGTGTVLLEYNDITSFAGWISGTNAASINFDIGILTKATLIFIGGLNSITGSINALSNAITYFNVSNVAITGSITNKSLLEYFSCSGIFTGSINSKPNLYYFSSDNGATNITGDIDYNTVLQSFRASGLSNIALSGVLNKPNLSSLIINGSGTILTSGVANQILADVWANRDIAKTQSSRTMIITGGTGSGAPTGQGITDKANLQAYRTPNNLPQYNLWTITTR